MSARPCGCDAAAGWTAKACKDAGYCLSDLTHVFGGKTAEQEAAELFGDVAPGSPVRASELEAADKREADERTQRAGACAACGRIWLHSLASGHGDKARRQADGQFWHNSCWTRRPR